MVLKTIFDHVIDKVLRLVDKQVDEIKEHGKPAKVCNSQLLPCALEHPPIKLGNPTSGWLWVQSIHEQTVS